MPNFAHGITKVSTPFFSILSDDDLLLPNFYQTAIAALEKHPEAGFFHGGLLFAGPDGNVVYTSENRWRKHGLIGPVDLFRSFLPGSWLTWTSTVFRTECVRAVGGIDIAVGHTGDVDLLQRLAVAHQAFLDPRPCAVFTMHPGSASGKTHHNVLRQHLGLRSYQNVLGAIASARSASVVSAAEAERMQKKLTRETLWSLFRNAMIFASDGETVLALQTSEVLLREFDRRDLAATLRVVGSGKLGGRAALSLIRFLRKSRPSMRRLRNERRERSHTRLVSQTLLALEASDQPIE
jgi:hypothetical protein